MGNGWEFTDMELNENFNETYPLFNKVLVHPSFKETIEEIRSLKVILPQLPFSEEWNFDSLDFSSNSFRVKNLEEIKPYPLDPRKGRVFLEKRVPIVGYDESILKFNALEGIAYLTSHSLVILGKKDYLPLNYVTFYFYTRSHAITNRSKYIKYSDNPELDAKKDYIRDRSRFLLESVPENSILLIDGPLIGGQVISHSVHMAEKLFEKKILPLFFVKNSNSNLVVDNVEKLRGQYNSDLHWGYQFLKSGERTNLFSFINPENKTQGKIFCYLKPFLNRSPQRIEFYFNVYETYQNLLQEIFDLLYYLILVQGDVNNPQIRPIAIAEQFARESLHLFNFTRIMKELGIIPIINQTRFGE